MIESEKILILKTKYEKEVNELNQEIDSYNNLSDLDYNEEDRQYLVGLLHRTQEIVKDLDKLVK